MALVNEGRLHQPENLRKQTDRLLAQNRPSDYSVRSIIDAIVQSELFLMK